MPILGDAIQLRAIEFSDLEFLHKWSNDPVTQQGIGESHFPSSLDLHDSWFRNLKDDPLNQRFIVDLPGYGPIGLSSITQIDWRNRRAWHGLVLGDSSHRGKGYGKDAIRTTMRYAFHELDLNRLDGGIIEYNEASLRTYCGERCGWVVEGRKREYFFREGRTWDQIVVGVTRADYETMIEKEAI
jgi:RimJ/RimL family protein N-acetyltransferase